MSDMIGRMAKAIMVARDDGECLVKDWMREGAENPHVAQALRQARAALAAIEETHVVVPREPTKQMAVAGEDAIQEAIDYTTDTHSTYIIELPMEWAMVGYRAMIAAAEKP
ncbi:hypothetical protein U0C82_03630 [Fulvimarina sp. 2208YS6-2-32]|uniref:Uncharacterized protein n=1 Tax=Fulvimarina uroteuthidis TaxID=3098149 RepID=A0ABU5HYQ3_9HYPH|nr:hypothetical protein [Fulvimarina sp. 2208YS6-2-32]MDY8108239.1 hypothetical protein [Fulvimarina sp. 2208YS6-2-32]